MEEGGGRFIGLLLHRVQVAQDHSHGLVGLAVEESHLALKIIPRSLLHTAKGRGGSLPVADHCRVEIGHGRGNVLARVRRVKTKKVLQLKEERKCVLVGY